MKKILSKEFTIGVSVIMAIVILFFGIDYLKGINLFKPANFYIATYKNVQGLEISAPVTIDGFKVGQVREIKFDYENPGNIDVVLALNKQLQLPENSTAMIGSSLLGGAFVEIKVGDSAKKLAVGSHINTSKKGDIMTDITEQVMPTVNSILPRVDSLIANLNTLVAHPALAQSIGRLDGITAHIEGITAGLKSTVGRDLPVIMGNVRTTTVNLDSITRNLGLLSRELHELPLQSTMGNVEAVSENLKTFSGKLNDPNSTLGLLMNDPELYNRLNRVAADVDSLIVDLKKNPKRYISIKLL